MSRTRIPNYGDPAFQAKREAEIKRRTSMEAYGDEPVALAYRGDTKLLADGLRAAGHEDVAWLVERKLQHGKRGRPRNSKSNVPVGPHTQNLCDATAEYVAGKRKWCAENDGVRCPAVIAKSILDEIAKRRGLSNKDQKYVTDRAKRGSHTK